MQILLRYSKKCFISIRKLNVDEILYFNKFHYLFGSCSVYYINGSYSKHLLSSEYYLIVFDFLIGWTIANTSNGFTTNR